MCKSAGIIIHFNTNIHELDIARLRLLRSSRNEPNLVGKSKATFPMPHSFTGAAFGCAGSALGVVSIELGSVVGWLGLPSD